MIEKLQFMTLMFVNDMKAAQAKRDERGATAVEYGLMVALIAIVIITAVSLLGKNLSALFTDIAGKITPGGTP